MSLAAVLLAAGRSTRFGAHDKMAAPLGDRPLGHHAAGTLAGLAIGRRYVVTAGGTLDWPGFAIVENARPDRGLASSLALGVAAARADGATAVLVALADMPFVPRAHYEALVARHRGPASLVASGDGARRMPPALFGANWFATLETLTGDRGAGALLAEAEVVSAAPDLLVDIDTRPDLERAQDRLARHARVDPWP